MIRQFQFEAEIYESLSCLPMAARRKLDSVGIKIGREQWQRFARGERLMICHAPADSESERAALQLFIEETTLARCGTKPKELPAEVREAARPPAAPPVQLVSNAAQLGTSITVESWGRLDDEQRYALIKLGGAEKPSHNLAPALKEFFSS